MKLFTFNSVETATSVTWFTLLDNLGKTASFSWKK